MVDLQSYIINMFLAYFLYANLKMSNYLLNKSTFYIFFFFKEHGS